jgi:hypothetical protein
MVIYLLPVTLLGSSFKSKAILDGVVEKIEKKAGKLKEYLLVQGRTPYSLRVCFEVFPLIFYLSSPYQLA